MTPYIADLLDYCTGPACDVYFQRAADTLAGAGLDPVVTMEYFGDRAGVLCGMPDVLDLVRRSLGGGGEVWSLDDGAAMAVREVVMRVRAPYSRFASGELPGTHSATERMAVTASMATEQMYGRPFCR